MNTIYRLFVLFLMCLFSLNRGVGQVTKVKLQLAYDTTYCWYDVKLIIIEGSATSPSNRVQFNSSITIVVPAGTVINLDGNSEVDSLYMPLVNNLAYNGTTPMLWILNSSAHAPAAQPQNDFYQFVPSLSPICRYNNLAAGDTIKLFSFTVTPSPTTTCTQGVRLFKNFDSGDYYPAAFPVWSMGNPATDPASYAPGMDGGNFNNGFTIGGIDQLYTGNAPQKIPPKKLAPADIACTNGISIDVDVNNSNCQGPMVYNWVAPNNNTYNTEDINLTTSNTAFSGTWKLTTTDGLGCKDTFLYTATISPNAGSNLQTCSNTNLNLTGSPIGGSWDILPEGNPGASIGSTSNGVATATFSDLANGPYKFTYRSGLCEDTVQVTVSKQVAGPPPSTINCYASDCATLNGQGTGTWTIGSCSSGTATIGNPTNPNTTVCGFSDAGTYCLIWTKGSCSDTIFVTVEDNCSCPISGNDIVQPSQEYCGNSGIVLISGTTPSPAGGSYLWEVSDDNGGNWSSAPGSNTGKNYSTINLGPGTYLYRRQYTTPSGFICSTQSNSITITVKSIPVSPNISSNTPLCEGDNIVLNADGVSGAIYHWSNSSTGWNSTDQNPVINAAGPNDDGVFSLNVEVDNCMSSPVTTSVIVNAIPAINLPDYGDMCQDESSINLSASTGSGIWSGSPGISGSSFNPANADIGLNEITYSVTVNGCSNTETKYIQVNSLPVISIGSFGPFCENVGVVPIGASPSNGVFTGSGVGGTVANPTFNPLGINGSTTLTYTVTQNGCTNSDNTTIIVHPMPILTFTSPGPLCTNSDAVVLNGSPTGGVYAGSIGLSGDDMFDPYALPSGTQNITYTVTSSDGCTNSSAISILIKPTPTISLNAFGPYCENVAPVTLSASPAGSFEATAYINAAGLFNPANAAVGANPVTYIATQNGCSDTASISITVNPKPVVSLGNYGPYCKDATPINLSATPASGTYSGPGVNAVSGIFNPSSASIGDNVIIYSYTSGLGCNNKDTSTIKVNVLPSAIAGTYGPMCAGSGSINLTGTPVGGVFSGGGISGDQINGYTFSPGTAMLGSQQIVYAYQDVNGCTDSDTTSITVNSKPTANAGTYSPLCENSPAVTLAGSPVGGTFSGNGTSGTNGLTFNPSGIVGTNVLTYIYSSAQGCKDTATTNFVVNAKPTALPGTYGPVCKNGLPITLSGTPSGVFSGTGTSGPMGSTFNPLNANAGSNIITFIATNAFTCKDTATTTIVVNTPVSSNAGTYTPLCADSNPLALGGTPSGGTFSGNGVEGDIASGFKFRPAGNMPLNNTVTYIYKDVNLCLDTSTASIVVNPKPTANAGTYASVCENSNSIALSGSPLPGIFSGSGVTGASFDPSSLSGSIVITYIYAAPGTGCKDTATTTINVNQKTVASAGTYTPLCKNSGVVNLVGNPLGGMFGGPAVNSAASTFNPAIASTGSNAITYIYTDANLCSDTATASIVVNSLPTANAGNYGAVCQDAPSVPLTGTPVGGIFSGNGVSGVTSSMYIFNPSLASVGPNTLVYTYIDANGCDDKDSTIITVLSKPVADAGTYTPVCENGTPIALTGSPNGGIFSGVGVSGNQISGYDFTPSSGILGNQIIEYYFTNASGCADTATTSIAVLQKPVVDGGNYGPLCINQGDLSLIGNPASGVYSGPGIAPNSNIFQPTLAGLGNHNILFTGTAANGCSNTDQITILVRSQPNISVGNYGPYCTGDAKIILSSTPNTGVVFTGNGIGTQGSSYTFDPALAGQGNHEITAEVTDINGCTNATSIFIEVDQTPNVSIGSFGPYCEDAAAEVLVGSPGGGTFSGPGINAIDQKTFDPSNASIGLNVISYSVQNGICTNSATTSILVNAKPNVSIGNYGPYCKDDAAVNLSGTPSNGVFTSTPYLTAGGLFTPTNTSSQQNSIVYTITDANQCVNSASTNITVNALPNLILDAVAPVCLNSPKVTLTTTPTSGVVISGNGVEFTGSSYTFDPLLAGTGTHIITAVVTDAITGCSNTTTGQITVLGLPVLSPGSFGPYCVNAADITLSGSPSNGIYSGPGILSNKFSPSLAGVGIHTISFSASDAQGCTNSSPFTINVNPLPIVTLGTFGPYCKDAAPVTLTGTPSGGVFSPTAYLTSAGLFTPANTTSTLNNIIYTVTDVNQCVNTAIKDITVNALPSLVLNSVAPLCLNASKINLTTSPATGVVITGNGVEQNGAIYTFDPTLAGTGTHTITATLNDATTGCSNTTTSQITVMDLPVLNPGSFGPYCVNAPDVTLSGSPANGTYSGPGTTNSKFTPSLAGVGTHSLTFTSTDAQGCTNTMPLTIKVNGLPNVSLGAFGPYCKDDAPVTMTGTPSGGIFSTTAYLTAGGVFTPANTTTTLNAIIYTVTDANLCVNNATADITVNALPSLTLNSVAPLCLNAAKVNLTTNPSSGVVIIGNGVAPNGPGYSFDPIIAGTGTHTITATVNDVATACSNTTTTQITVMGLPVLNPGSFGPYCANSPDITLSGFPSDGVYSGNGIIGNKFSPSVAGVGIHTLNFNATDAQGCANTAQLTIEVKALPVVSLGAFGPYCKDSGPVTITGTPSGGVFTSAPYLTTGGIFSPANATNASNAIIYTVTDANLCVNSATTNVTVNAIPSLVLDNIAPICLNAPKVNIITTPTTGVTITGNGVTWNGSIYTFDPMAAGTGTHTITAVINDALTGCSNSTTGQVTVFGLPGLNPGNFGPYCIDDAAKTLTGFPNTGIFTGPGIVVNNQFTPSLAGIGTHTIEFKATDTNGCYDTTTISIEVKDKPGVTLGSYGPYCKDALSVTLTGTPMNGLFSGNGISSSGVFTPSTAIIGNNTITYTVNDGICSANASTIIVVNDKPAIPLVSSNTPVCEGQNIDLSAGIIPNASYEWLVGNTVIANTQNHTIPNCTIANAGTYTLIAKVNGCPSDAATTIVAVSKKINAGTDVNLSCVDLQNVSLTLNASGSGQWTKISGPAVSIAPISAVNAVVSGFSASGVYQLKWSDNVCSDSLMITVSEKPNAGPNKTIACFATGSAVLSASGIGTWTVAAESPGYPLLPTFNANDPNTVVTNLSEGAYVMIWNTGTCSDTASIFVGKDCVCPIGNNVLAVPSPKDFCASSGPVNITGGSVTPAGGSYLWQYDAGSGFIDAAGFNDGKDYVTLSLSAGQHKFRRLYTSNVAPICTDTSNIVEIQVSAPITAGNDQTLSCIKLQTASITMNGTGVGIWSEISSPGTYSISAINNATTSVNNFSKEGTYKFKFSNALCSDTVNIVLTEEASAGPNPIPVQCWSTEIVDLHAIGSGAWTILPSSTSTGIFLDSNDATTSLTPGSPGILELEWTASNGCKDQLSIAVDDDCVCPIANNQILQPAIQSYCDVSPAISIDGSTANPAGGNYLWQYKNAGTFVDASASNNNEDYVTSALPIGTHQFRRIYTTTVEPICSDTSNIITIEVKAKPNAGIDQQLLCIDLPGGSVTMSGLGSGTWSAVNGQPNSSITNPASSTTTITNFANEAIYSYVYSSNGCGDTVSVKITKSADAGPSPANISCWATGTVFLNAFGAGSWSIVSALGGTLNNANSSNASITALDGPGIIIAEWTTGSGCKDQVSVNIGVCNCPIANNSISQPSVNSYCGTSPAINIDGSSATPSAGSYLWLYSSDNINFNPASAPNDNEDYITGNLSVGNHTFKRVYTTTLAPICSDTSNVVTIVVNPIPDAGPDKDALCIALPGGSIPLSAIGSGSWREVIGQPTSTLSSTTAPIITVSNFTLESIYSYIYTENGCSDTARITITKEADAGPNPGNINCWATGTIFLNAIGTGSWSIVSSLGGTLNNANSPSATITSLDGPGTILAEWTTSAGCKDQVSVNVDICNCQIANNTISQPTANSYCGSSPLINIDGSSATPSAGSYLWLYSVDNINYTTAPAPNDNEDYSISGLSLGNHSFKRVYTTTLAPICSDTSNVVSILVNPAPDAGPDKEALCIALPGGSVTLTALGNGSWREVSGQPASTLSSTTSSSITVSNFNLESIYSYIYTDNGCSDTASVTVTKEADAGLTPASVNCWSTATVVLNASGIGKWSMLGTTTTGGVIADPDNKSTSVTSFTSQGNLNLEWKTNNGCTDNVLVTIGNNCSCTISNNVLTPAPKLEYCGASQVMSLEGSTASPSAGTYVWQYNLNGIGWTGASAPNFGEDYQTLQYAVGKHCFRRIYTTTSAPICADTSNVICFDVYEAPNAGSDKILSCVSVPGGQIAMTGTGVGIWEAAAANPGTVKIQSPNSPTTVISDFEKVGIYEFYLKNAICDDAVKITVNDKANAGPNPSDVNCYLTGNAIINALDNQGSWQVLPGTPTGQVLNPTNALTSVSADGPGTVILVWTNANNCTDTVEVKFNNNCACLVAGNNIIPPGTQQFCSSTGQVLIDANPASPIGGTYTWEYAPPSTGIFGPAINTINEEDYICPDIIEPGIHKFRRLYTTTVAPICTDTSNQIQLLVLEPKTAGPDRQVLCADLKGGSVIMDGAGIASWFTGNNNPGTSTIVDVTDPKTEIKDFSAPGEYIFMWGDASCLDTAIVTVTEAAHAGMDQTVKCFSVDFATMDAVGNGVWALGLGGTITATIADDKDKNTQVGFNEKGTVEMIWTNTFGCIDTATILVNDICDCNISNNNITQPATNEFCGQSPLISITGNAATPSGNYQWQYTNTNVFNVAPGISTSKDYTTANLNPGTYTFRRIFTNTVAPICSDTSNLVTIKVVPIPDAGTDKLLSCITLNNGQVTMNAVGAGNWSVIAGNAGNSTITSTTSSTTSITGFSKEGVYKYAWLQNGCTDTVSVTVSQQANAGSTPPTINCYQTGSAIMGAVGQGQWTIASNSTISGTIVSISDPNTIINKFSDKGILNVVWTSTSGCKDTLSITTSDVNCICPIASNLISVPEESKEFCESVSSLFIDGTPSSPTGGTYLWQYSLNNGPYVAAAGKNDLEDYTSTTLSTGTHKFRRVYAIKGQIDCADTSNVVTAVGINGVDAGPNQEFKCVELNNVVLHAIGNGNGEWFALGTNPSSIVIDDINDPQASMSGFSKAGIYEFTFSNSACSSTMQVTITEKVNAGVDKNVDCYFEATVNIIATGKGTWSTATNSTTNGIIEDILSPNTFVSKISGPGKLNLVWTSVDNCADTISVLSDDNCPCNIGNNAVTGPAVTTFCTHSGNIILNGSNPSPSGGLISWLYSFNDGPFTIADSIHDEISYATLNLSEGKHQFKRVYTTGLPGCVDSSETITLYVISEKLPEVSLTMSPDSVCLGDTIYLHATGVDGASYNWTSDKDGLGITSGEANLISPLTSGEFSVTVVQNAKVCGSTKQSEPVTVKGKILERPIIDLGRDTTYCVIEAPRVLDAGDHDTYEWSNGSSSQTIDVKESGIYAVTVTDDNGCSNYSDVAIKDFCCEFVYPNIIIAESGSNTEFALTDKYSCVIKSELRIYDRWGNMVYYSTDGLKPWDGTFKGRKVDEGVYVFIFTYSALDENDQPFEDIVKGDITVLW